MKKLFALALAGMMLGSCTMAMAEEVETEVIEVEASVYTFDETLVEDVEGEFMGLEEFGLQFFVPSDFVAYEPSEEDVAKGVISIMGTEDMSAFISISHAGVADAEGNLINNLIDLAAFYEANGTEYVEIALNNDLECLAYTIAEPTPYMGIAFCTELETVLGFNVMTAEEEDLEAYANILLGSIMAMETVAETEMEAAE